MVDSRIDSRFYRPLGPLSLNTLLEGLSATVTDPKSLDIKISQVAPLGNSCASDLVFLENRKHIERLKPSTALACFVKEADADLVSGKSVLPIITPTPRAHFARVLAKLYSNVSPTYTRKVSGRDKNTKIHPSAIIASDVEIGRDVEIGPYSVIGAGVIIGAGTKIGSNVDISHAIIGENCIIKSGSVIGGTGFGVAHDERGIVDIPHLGRVILSDRVSIGSQSCVDRGQLGDTMIGTDTKIDNLVQIAHNVVIGTGCAIAGHSGLSGSCILGDYVMLGGSVGLADHVEIGDKASIAARSGVMHNIPAGETWFGTPAQPIRDQMRMISRMRKLASSPKSKL